MAPLEATEALLVLIPKEEKPTSIRGFRPISICNMNIKFVIKAIVNWPESDSEWPESDSEVILKN